MPIGTAVHERTLALCESLNFREWSGYYAVSAYEAHHEHEYNAIRNAAALIDVSPLFKYLIDRPRRRGARRSRHHARRDVRSPWARSTTRRGATSGARSSTMARSRGLPNDRSAGPPPIRACAGSAQNAAGLEVRHRGRFGAGGRPRAAGPHLRPPAQRGRGRRFRNAQVLPDDARGSIAGVPVDISRTGIHGRSRLRDLDCRGIARSRSGTR